MTYSPFRIELFRESLRFMMESRGSDYNELARRLGLAPSTVWRVMKGPGGPSADTFLRICFELGLDPFDYFLTDWSPPNLRECKGGSDA
jgi:transcriptional regulator with XRE-family HTH domain